MVARIKTSKKLQALLGAATFCALTMILAIAGSSTSTPRQPGLASETPGRQLAFAATTTRPNQNLGLNTTQTGRVEANSAATTTSKLTLTTITPTTVTPTTQPTVSLTTATPLNSASVVGTNQQAAVSPDKNRERTYSIKISDPQVDAAAAAVEISNIVSDQRSWIGDGSTSFRQVEQDGSFAIFIAMPELVDRMCAPLRTVGYFSCRNGSNIVLNSHRWVNAVEGWQGDLVSYRQYLVNHEIGHLLGNGHRQCPGNGQPAPVMMQQSRTIGACAPNSWPYPNS